MPIPIWPEPSPFLREWAHALDAERTGENQWRANCPNPAHNDTHPSFGFRAGRSQPVVGNCYGCDDWEGIKVGLDALGLSTAVFGRTTRKAVASRAPKNKPVEIAPLGDQDKPDDWHALLMAHPEHKHYRYLTAQRGMTDETLKRFRIGSDGVDRITIPVRRSFGEWINVRLLDPWADKKHKMLNTLGHGTITLYLAELLQGNTLPVLLCEGELDSLLANQKSEGQYIALSFTGGASNVPRDLSPLVGREVFVAYDLDEAGRSGALKAVAALNSAGAVARVLDLARLGLRE